MPKKSVHAAAAAEASETPVVEDAEALKRKKRKERDEEPVSAFGDIRLFALPWCVGMFYLCFCAMGLWRTERPDWSGRNAFVTGATGATGRQVVAQLANKDWTVYALTRKDASDKLDLFPDLSSSKLEQVNLMLESDIETWSKTVPLPLPENLDAMFLCHGTSREYQAVQDDIATAGQDGFAKWLTK